MSEVLAPIQQEPALREAVEGADEYVGAEIRYAVTHEGALHLDDVLTRRTGISIETTHRGVDSAADAARLLAPELRRTRETQLS